MGRGRGQSAGLSVEQLSREALALADEQGLAALTVRALAGRLGVSPMSIYNHFPHKEALLEAVWDQVLVNASPADPVGETWQECAEALAHRLRAVLLLHPAVLPAMLGRAARTPRALDLVEQSLGLLTRRGLPLSEAVDLVNNLTMFTIAHALNEHLLAQSPPPAVDPERQPTLARALDEGVGRDLGDDERRFSAAVRALVRGVAEPIR